MPGASDVAPAGSADGAAAPDGLSATAGDTAPDTVIPASAPCVFAAWDPSLYVTTEVSARVRAILDARRGGNYGLTAPRGSGKSWLLQEAINWAEEMGGLGIVFPSPSKDAPADFMAALSEVFAQSYIDHFVKQSPASTQQGLRRRTQLLLLSVLGIYLGVALIVLGALGSLPKISGPVYAGAVVLVATISLFIYSLTRGRSKPLSAYEQALEFQRQVRYAAAFSSSSQLSGSLAQLGATLGFNTTKGENLTERPVTMSSLVHGFRQFCKNVVGAVKGPVVIAIDELDKVDSTQDVIELLRAIKGIFDIKGVHYFVSISDEAARRLELGGIRERDEFNSSFYQVFQLGRANRAMVRELLDKRKVPVSESVAAAVTILSGGVPREIIRLVDVVQNAPVDGPPQARPEFIILSTEVNAFRDEIESARDETIEDNDRVFVSQTVGDDTADQDTFAQADFYRWWQMGSTSDGFRKQYASDFRRLLNRLMVGRIISFRGDDITDDEVQRLQQAIAANERDAWPGYLAIYRLPAELQTLGPVSVPTRPGDGTEGAGPEAGETASAEVAETEAEQSESGQTTGADEEQ